MISLLNLHKRKGYCNMKALAIARRTMKWRMKHMVVVMMTLTQPLLWLLLFSRMFSGSNDENYTAFIIPGILVMNILSGAGMSGISNYSLLASGSYYRLYISPIKRSFIVMGHLIDITILTLIESVLLFVISMFFGVVLPDLVHLLLMVMIIIFATSTIAALSYAASYLFQSQDPFVALINTLMLPLFFVSTALMPMEAIPSFFIPIVKLNPLTYVINALRTLLLENTIPWTSFSILFFILLISSAASFVLARTCIEKHAVQ